MVWRTDIGTRFQIKLVSISDQLKDLTLLQLLMLVCLIISKFAKKLEKRHIKSFTLKDHLIRWLLTGKIKTLCYPNSNKQQHSILLVSMMPLLCSMNTLLQHKLWHSVHSKSLLKKKLKSGILRWSWFQIPLKNGLNAKDNGCISNLYSIVLILWNNYLKRLRDSNQLIQHGDTFLIRLNKHQTFYSHAQKKVLRRNSKRQIRILKSCRRVSQTILRRRDQYSLDSISFQMMSYLKFFHRPRKSEMSDHISERSLRLWLISNSRVTIPFGLCSQVKVKKLTL